MTIMKNNSLLMMMMAIIMTMTTTTITTVVHAAPLNDLILDLPGYGRPPTPQFSGYLDASAGCDVTINGPIFLWLNGGPGSSSLLGWLQEVGPLLMNATGGLMTNPYSWINAGVNLLVLEAPMGVGFSYCSRMMMKDNEKLPLPCINSDTSTAKASRAALVDFFTTKFPELSNGPFYISGESYAGVYIPTLSKELLNDPIAKQTVPLKGIMVGDPCTDNDAQRDSMDPLWYSNKYGLMDTDVYDTLQSKECAGIYDFMKTKTTMMMMNQQRNFTANVKLSSKTHQSVGGEKWSNHVTAAELNAELIGIENLVERRIKANELYKQRVLLLGNNDADDADADATTAGHIRTTLRNSASAVEPTSPTSPNRKIDDKCTLAYRKFLLSSSHSLSQGWNDLYIDDYSLFAPVTSKEDQQMATYLNRQDVRQALHVEESPVKTWPMDQDIGFSYKKQYNACNWQSNIEFPNTSMIDLYQEIIPSLDRTWIYNGDTDPCVSYEGTREAVKQILFEEVDGGSYRPWFYNQTATSISVLQEKSILFGPNLIVQSLENAQFGGEVVNYSNGLSFITFHGSGHMVPQFRPQAALHFLQKFVHGNDIENNKENGVEVDNNFLLSPLLKSNETLIGLSNNEFEEYIQEWTESAMTKPYVG
ncbi:alpha/beta-hydrolase [Fragilariopsis cylindrus CCMP1102]|uniref:Carboxypeptidase n=1 Tax=Fragilariopsis cylindrus CCMP1102 TaxID=635003 RepID=A0A1E7FJ39_9STRA|nr:alpha/beta-hydrolase [Fragilariopsis cylindrus CCMP1102]|eukprot:OEU18202.1 alpha/beta-hydrolase [Fragilariopsis cylindrus CCMP1102]